MLMAGLEDKGNVLQSALNDPSTHAMSPYAGSVAEPINFDTKPLEPPDQAERNKLLLLSLSLRPPSLAAQRFIDHGCTDYLSPGCEHIPLVDSDSPLTMVTLPGRISYTCYEGTRDSTNSKHYRATSVDEHFIGYCASQKTTINQMLELLEKDIMLEVHWTSDV
jgi:hypothetical protein